MVLIPSQRYSSVPKFHLRKGLYENKFVLFGFILHSLATEKEMRNTLEAAFIDKLAFTPVENKFEFFCAVEKKIVRMQNTDEITGEVFKHFVVPGDQYTLEAKLIWQPFNPTEIFLNKTLIVTIQPLMNFTNFMASQWRKLLL